MVGCVISPANASTCRIYGDGEYTVQSCDNGSFTLRISMEGGGSMASLMPGLRDILVSRCGRFIEGRRGIDSARFSNKAPLARFGMPGQGKVEACGR
jgi:hypothetical protein